MNNENWLLKLWNSRGKKWFRKTDKGPILSDTENLLRCVGTPPINGFLCLISHLRSNEEFITQILCWLLNHPDNTQFQTAFLELIKIKCADAKFEFSPEVKDGQDRYDIVIYETVKSERMIAGIIEAKVGADFGFNQLERYRKKTNRLITITRFDYLPSHGELHIFWHQIYPLFSFINDQIIRRSVTEVFEAFYLQYSEFSNEPRAEARQEIINETRAIIKANTNMAIYENRTTYKKGFCNFIVYRQDAQLISGEGEKYIHVIPSLNIMLNGYWVQGCNTDKKNTNGCLLRLSGKIFHNGMMKKSKKQLEDKGWLDDLEEKKFIAFKKFMEYPSTICETEDNFWVHAKCFIKEAIIEFEKTQSVNTDAKCPSGNVIL